jgi:hypothetical protein
MLENCTGLNLYNHLKQTNANIKVEFIQNTYKYDFNFDIPDFWLKNRDRYSENINKFLKRSKDNKLLLKLIEEGYNINDNESKIYELKKNNRDNLKVITSLNPYYMHWTCIVEYNGNKYESMNISKKNSLKNIMDEL